MKKLMLALASIALIATASFASAPTEVKNMKIKAKEKDGVVSAKISIKHDMLTYEQAEKKGQEANFIAHITGTVGDKVVYDVSTSQFLSKNPLIKFEFAGKKGDTLKITYTQLKGEVFFAEKKIK
jgi:sulfur-oxidizing protein SoxZ